MPTLVEVRAAAHLTQRELAARSGISPTTIARIERGRIRPCPRVVTRLSHVLGKPPEAITEFRAIAFRTRLPNPTVFADRPHLLVLDASAAVLDALRDLLEGGGYRVSTGSCTDLDLNTILRQAPDVILLGDVGVNEGPCWNQLRADPDTAAIPLILSTSSTSAGGDVEEMAQQLTESDLWVVTRPFDLDALLGAVRAALHPPEGQT